jgi:hypothetical protein
VIDKKKCNNCAHCLVLSTCLPDTHFKVSGLEDALLHPEDALSRLFGPTVLEVRRFGLVSFHSGQGLFRKSGHTHKLLDQAGCL